MPTTIYQIKDLQDGRFSIMPHPLGGDSLIQDVSNWKSLQIDLVVSLLTKEEQRELDLESEGHECERENIEFLNFPIRDEVPDSQSETMKFIDILEKKLVSCVNILFHCRGGVGRSSMMLALLVSKLGIDPQEAFKLITETRGEQAPETPYQAEWVIKTIKSNNPHHDR